MSPVVAGCRWVFPLNFPLAKEWLNRDFMLQRSTTPLVELWACPNLGRAYDAVISYSTWFKNSARSVAKLRQIDVLVAQGRTIGQVGLIRLPA